MLKCSLPQHGSKKPGRQKDNLSQLRLIGGFSTSLDIITSYVEASRSLKNPRKAFQSQEMKISSFHNSRI